MAPQPRSKTVVPKQGGVKGGLQVVPLQAPPEVVRAGDVRIRAHRLVDILGGGISSMDGEDGPVSDAQEAAHACMRVAYDVALELVRLTGDEP